MTSDLNWVFQKVKYPTRLWKLFSYSVIGSVGFVAKIIMLYGNKTRIHNIKILEEAINKREPGTPLLTVSNHDSCVDDPGMWGLLPLNIACNTNKIRWSLAAHDICFTEKRHAWFFLFGKGIPVVRGAGIYQPAVDLCIEKLNNGEWVHIFPEGKVNMTKEELRLKWGVGRMIWESSSVPLVVPIWHMGMEEILPNYPPYYLKFFKTVTYNYGKPIDLRQLVKELKASNASNEEARKVITDTIQDAMYKLRAETEELHKKV